MIEFQEILSNLEESFNFAICSDKFERLYIYRLFASLCAYDIQNLLLVPLVEESYFLESSGSENVIL